jgi:hypothetical protein
MSKESELITERINFYFTGVFILEMVLKLIAYSTRYFKDNWNVFDFIIVICSVAFIIIKQVGGSSLGSTTQVVRTMRISRMLKLFRNLE